MPLSRVKWNSVFWVPGSCWGSLNGLHGNKGWDDGPWVKWMDSLWLLPQWDSGTSLDPIPCLYLPDSSKQRDSAWVSRCWQSFLDTGYRVPPYSVHGHSALVPVPLWTFQLPFPDSGDFKSSMSHRCLSFLCLVFPDLSKPRWFPGSPCTGVAANQPLDFGFICSIM